MIANKIRYPKEPVVIVDIEGNGQKIPDIIEISIRVFDPNSIEQPKAENWLIKPPKKILPIVTRIHGIRNSDLKKCPTWEAVSDDIKKRLKNVWFVAHNANIDYKVIKRHIPDWDPVGVIDTLKLAKHILPYEKSYSLENLVKSLEILPSENIIFHRADDDTLATSLLFQHLLSKMRDKNWEHLCKIAMLNPIKIDKSYSPTQGELW